MKDTFRITDNDHFTVSQMGQLFGVSPQTLHHYDKMGLFQPEMRDENNSYRLYRFDQIYQLASIRFLRKLDLPLEDIRGYLNEKTLDGTLAVLEERMEALREQWTSLMRIHNAIERKILFTEEKLRNLDEDSVQIRTFPERRYIPIGHEEQLYMDDSFYFYPTLVLYQGEERLFGAYVTDADIADSEAAFGSIPAGRYLTGYHRGPYETISDSFGRMRSAAPGAKVDSWIVAQNIIDQFVENDRSQYLTEIQMPLL